MRRRLPNTVYDWEKMLKEVYETQGSSDFAKYQYTISSILRLARNNASVEKMLEYCADISNPKDILISAVSDVMLDHTVDTKVRVAAAATLRSLISRMQDYTGLQAAVMVEAIQNVLQETHEDTLHSALKQTINAATRRLQACPRAYAIKL